MTLPADVRSVGRAREALREALKDTQAHELLEPAQLAVSELVTNAVVHAGTEIGLRILATGSSLRVEVADGSTHLPVRRTWSPTAGTGRGLHVVSESTDRWDVELTDHGKKVWFEIGRLPEPVAPAGEPSRRPGNREGHVVQVTLVDVPLLMHRAWQEHAATLLREYLLCVLEKDPTALEDHAAASDALSILDEQVPVPILPDDPEALMADSVEPGVTGGSLVLQVPRASLPHFAVLDDLLSRAVAAAKEGRLLAPPTQPEIAEMRQWLCREVMGQAAGSAEPRPWRARTDVRVPQDERAPLARAYRELAASPEPLLATDEANVIVAVTPAVVQLLGYRDEAELLGRRVIAIIPERYRQAHIAGTTFHATNGRDALLARWITAPVLRADGSEVTAEFLVEPRRLEDRRIFLATFRIG